MHACGQDIAIVGMAGMFPDAPDKDAFWKNILRSHCAISEAPSGWAWGEEMIDADVGDIARVYTRHGGFLGEVATFDPRQFGTMPVSLAGGEPDQFLALKVAAEALADAGMKEGQFDGERIGIILGHAIHANRANVNGICQGWMVDQTLELLKAIQPALGESDIARMRRLLKASLPPLAPDSIPGLVPNIMTGRIANRLNLMGPNYILDAACASTPAAIDIAIGELRARRADVMLAGGVNSTSSPLVFMVFSQLGALSRQSRIRPFDSHCDGTLLGEGLGIFVLKRLEDAERAGDRIYAVIKEIGQSSDGRATGLMAPRHEGQVLAMQRAYRQSDICPESIGLLECHGTGIPLGDQTEIRSLRSIFGGRMKPYPHLPIGSVKSMIGHCIPAAGAASLIKVAMALHHKLLPPTLCEEVNPALGLDQTPFFVNTAVSPWLQAPQTPRRAGLNAFGFGGINSHMILEEAPGSAFSDTTSAYHLRIPDASTLFAVCAESREALLGKLENLQLQVRAGVRLPELGRALAGEADGSAGYRVAIVAGNAAELLTRLEKLLREIGSRDHFSARSGIYFESRDLTGRIAFLFPGENSQYPEMLKGLALAFPEVRKWLDFGEGLFPDRETALSGMVYPPSTGIESVQRDELERMLRKVDWGSEAVFVANQAIFSLLERLAVKPDFFLGHSTGENAAIVASDMLGYAREDVAANIRRMNDMFTEIETRGEIPRGVLLSVGAASRSEIFDALNAFEPEGLYLTMDNCPNQAIFWGPEEAIEKAEEKLARTGAICAHLPLDWPYHTPLIRPLAEAFSQWFMKLAPGKGKGVLYSCVDASPFPTDPEAFRETAFNQYTNRVRFVDAVERLYEDGARVFVEVGPGSNLTGFVKDILKGRPHLAVSADNRRQDSLEHFLHLIGQLFVHRVPMDLAPLYVEEMPRAKAQKSAVLPNELPFIRLDASAADEIRKMLFGPAGASAGDGHSTTPAPAPVTAPGAVLAQHMVLMNEFLGQQAALTAGVIGAPRQDVRDVGPLFRFPVPIEAAYVGVLEQQAPVWLTELERCFLADNAGHWKEGRRQEWLSGRLVAKTAVRAWLKGKAEDVPLHDISVLCEEGGRPVVRLRTSDGDWIGGPRISLSHAQGVAVAVCSQAGVGIDVEFAARISDAQGLLNYAFGGAERRHVEALAGSLQERLALSWSMKEAAAKAAGTGLLGREQAFEIVALAGPAPAATICYEKRLFEVQAAKLGQSWLSIAQERN
ncbi:acyltransferase domain-containing protein [Thauera aromatica]|nr:type I polyketide synthase [Thauera aromatica]MCK2126473.1 acyltransferase domain-containing protein [Thauera aromatica]